MRTRWVDFPPLVEFVDRRGKVRGVRSPTVFGRFEFVEAMESIHQILADCDPSTPWTDVYLESELLRQQVKTALACWGVKTKWLSGSQIEEFLFALEGGREGLLVELLKASSTAPAQESARSEPTLAEFLASIAERVGSLSEAIDLAQSIPSDLLVDALVAQGRAAMASADPNREAKAQYDRDMAAFDGAELEEVDL